MRCFLAIVVAILPVLTVGCEPPDLAEPTPPSPPPPQPSSTEPPAATAAPGIPSPTSEPGGPSIPERMAALVCSRMQSDGYDIRNCQAMGLRQDVLQIESNDCGNRQMREVIVQSTRDHFRTAMCIDQSSPRRGWRHNL